jgi:hypothetical protein
MPFTSSIPGPAGPQGPAGNASATDTYDKLYVTNNGAGTNIKVGDDAWLGDVNSANNISVQGVEDATKGGFIFGNNLSEKIYSDGTNLKLEADNDVILYPGSDYAYIGAPTQNGSTRIADWQYVWDYVQTGRHGSSASYWSTVDQTGTANSIQAMTLTDTDWQTGIALESGSHIKFTSAGKYNIAFSAQFRQPQGSGTINIWLAKNGTAIANSNTKVSIAANNPYAVAAWNFFVDAAANDYYQIMWSSDDARTLIEYEASVGSGATLHPAVPSVILTVNQVG